MNGIVDRVHLALAWVRRRAAAHLTLVWIFLPVTLLALALAAYGWWWQVVAGSVRSAVTDFQNEQRTLGREVKWDAFAVAGFPYRIVGTLDAAHLTAPDRAVAYDGERIVVEVHPLAVNRVTFSLEGQQRIFHARERYVEANARADTSRITLASERGTENVSVEIKRLTGKGRLDDIDVNFIVEEAEGGLLVTAPEGRETLPRVELLARLKNVALQGNLDLPLGSAIAWIDVDAAVKMPANLPEASVPILFSEWRRTGTPIEIRRFELEWGGVSLAASGEVKIDAQSLPEGRLLLTIGNHPRILELMRAYGAITQETETLARKVLDVLAFMSGDKNRRVTVPLRIAEGTVYLGPAAVATLSPEPQVAQPVPQEPVAVP